MTTKATQLIKPRLAHIAGVDHPAHRKEGFIVAKSLNNNENFNLLEGLPMDLNVIQKSLDTPLNKENAADVLKSLQAGVSYLINKAVEDDKEKKELPAFLKEDETEAEASAEEESKAKAKAKAEDAEEPDMEVAMSKALQSNSEFVAMKKQLGDYQARELFETTQTAVKKAAGALQTDTSGFVQAVIGAGGVDSPSGKAILKSLKATAEQLEVGGSFTKEIGANGMVISADAKSANAQFKSIAKAIAKAENLSMVDALTQAAKRNPELREILTGGAN